MLLYYFNHHTDKKNIHFVKKNSERVVVSLSGSKSRSKSNSQVKKSKNSKKKKSLKDKKPIKKKKRVKKSKNIKKKKVSKSSKSTQKEKKTKKTKISKKNQKPKKINSLFDNIDDKKLIDSNKKKQDRGVENAYFAKIQDILQGWNAQSDFAGESATIWVKINRDGSFKFKLLRPSNNLEFNNGLIEYIKQLQKIGFDPHKNSKSYELEVEFVAKE
ncbi:TonB-like; putative TolA function [hydrothermal vent metagenome]|uniref:TonB-like putative TolA function n=1 Tax=hydrothermal vent metagenome TaxID=652676 RepID=A0A1W1C6Y2_9ZZZZ